MNINETTTKTVVSGLTVTLNEVEIARVISALGQRFGERDALRTSFMRAIGDVEGLLTSAAKDEGSVLRVALAEGKKITAIKEVRAITAWGLKDSKDWVDAYIKDHPDHHQTTTKVDADLVALREKLMAPPQTAYAATVSPSEIVSIPSYADDYYDYSGEARDYYCCYDCDRYSKAIS